MTAILQAVRGMNDILPADTFCWQQAEHIMRTVLQSHGYQEIRFPIVEKTDLFKRSIGEVTDIVEKEMYTFLDRNQESLSLRPEGTAGCVRAGIQHGLLYNQIQKLWYTGPYFRHERPQKGRYRQFYQLGAEVFGLPGPDIDAEVILMSAVILEKLGIKPFVTLELNTLGTPAARSAYRVELVNYLQAHKDALDEDSIRRIETNPMRVLDSKNPALKSIILNAPKLIHFIDEETAAHFDKLQTYLSAVGVNFNINPFLVRGLDYYTKTVFEWVTDKLGAQGTVCAGGRYDNLVEQLGGKSTPALGFAIGMERTILLMQQKTDAAYTAALHAYLITDSDASFSAGLTLANDLRNKVPNLRIVTHMNGGQLKQQLKKADKSGALYAIILGENERQQGIVSLKPLREAVPQQMFTQEALISYLMTVVT